MISEFHLHHLLAEVSSVLFANKIRYKYVGHSHPNRNEDIITLHYVADEIHSCVIRSLSLLCNRVSVSYNGNEFEIYVTVSFIEDDIPF